MSILWKGNKVFEQIALLEFDNCGPQIIKYVSKKPITLNRLVRHIEKREPDINWDRSSITLISEITTEIMG